MNEKNKQIIVSILGALIFPILFNVIFFFSISNFTPTRWISYAGIHLAYLFYQLSVCSIPKVNGGAVYGYPKILIALSLFFAELIVGVIFILINNNSYVFPLVVQALIVSGKISFYLLLMLSESHSIESDRIDAKNIHFIKNASYNLENTLKLVSDQKLYKTIETLHDAVKSAQVRSIPDVYDEECKLMEIINEINLDVVTGDKEKIQPLVAKGMSLLNSRNSKIKLSR